jgi:hypothetical protein
MGFEIHYQDGSVENVDLDFSTMTYEDLKPFADLGIGPALDAMKKLIGYDYLKPANKTTLDDVHYYMRWLEKNNPERYKEIMALNDEPETEEPA